MNCAGTLERDGRRPATHSEWRRADAELLCPITQVMFEDPVLAPDGSSFDREAIITWMAHDRRLPTSGLSVPPEWPWPPNVSLRGRVAAALAAPGGSHTSPPPLPPDVLPPAPDTAAVSAPEDGTGALLHLTLHDLTGLRIALCCPADTRISELKARVEEVRGMTADRQRIVFNRAVLADERTLASYGVTDGARLTLVMRIAGD